VTDIEKARADAEKRKRAELDRKIMDRAKHLTGRAEP
jgi:hypothetical protein